MVVPFVNQYIEIDEPSERDVSINRARQDRPFEWDDRDLVRFEEVQKFDQFLGKTSVARSIDAQNGSKLVENGYGTGLREHQAEVEAQQWRYLVLGCSLDQIGPVDILFEQNSNPPRRFSIDDGPGTTEQQLTFKPMSWRLGFFAK